MKKKAESFIAKPSELFFRKMRHAVSIQKDLSRIGGLEQTENAKQKSSAATIRTAKLAKHSRIEGGGDVFDQCPSHLVPIHAMAAESLAGKNGVHFNLEGNAVRSVLAAFVKAHPGGKDPSARDSAEDFEKDRPEMPPNGSSKKSVASVFQSLQQK